MITYSWTFQNLVSSSGSRKLYFSWCDIVLCIMTAKSLESKWLIDVKCSQVIPLTWGMNLSYDWLARGFTFSKFKKWSCSQCDTDKINKWSNHQKQNLFCMQPSHSLVYELFSSPSTWLCEGLSWLCFHRCDVSGSERWSRPNVRIGTFLLHHGEFVCVPRCRWCSRTRMVLESPRLRKPRLYADRRRRAAWTAEG